MNSLKNLLFILLTLVFTACIQDDFVDDYIEPEIRISNGVESLKVGDSHQYLAIFYNNIGMEETTALIWESSNTDIFTVNENGLVTAVLKGKAILIVSTIYQGKTIRSEVPINVAGETVIINIGDRTGTLRTTSSYALKGSFILKEEGNTYCSSIPG